MKNRASVRYAGRSGGPRDEGMGPEDPGPGRRGRGRGPGRGRRGAPEPVATSVEELSAWFAGGVDDGWFTEPVEVRFDRDEIQVTGTLPEPEVAAGAPTEVAETARIEAFRESSRDGRISVAKRAEERFERKVSWRARCGSTTADFTTAGVPAMTRLGFDQRVILDTLIDAGVARSRSEALAWCVELVGEHESDWIQQLRDALSAVEAARADGPTGR